MAQCFCQLSDDLPIMLDEIILKPSKRMVFHFFLGSLMFGLGGMLLLRDHTKAHEVWIVYGCFFASGLSGLLAIWLLLPGRAFLKIYTDGLEIGYLGRVSSIRWTDIETFGVYEYTTYPAGFPIKHRQVGIRLSESNEDAKNCSLNSGKNNGKSKLARLFKACSKPIHRKSR